MYLCPCMYSVYLPTLEMPTPELVSIIHFCFLLLTNHFLSCPCTFVAIDNVITSNVDNLIANETYLYSILEISPTTDLFHKVIVYNGEWPCWKQQFKS